MQTIGRKIVKTDSVPHACTQIIDYYSRLSFGGSREVGVLTKGCNLHGSVLIDGLNHIIIFLRCMSLPTMHLISITYVYLIMNRYKRQTGASP